MLSLLHLAIYLNRQLERADFWSCPFGFAYELKLEIAVIAIAEDSTASVVVANIYVTSGDRVVERFLFKHASTSRLTGTKH
jgi:hypothetical protein